MKIVNLAAAVTISSTITCFAQDGAVLASECKKNDFDCLQRAVTLLERKVKALEDLKLGEFKETAVKKDSPFRLYVDGRPGACLMWISERETYFFDCGVGGPPDDRVLRIK